MGITWGFVPFVLFASVAVFPQNPPAVPPNSQPLEIGLAETPSWQGNCLKLTIRLRNRSRGLIFLLNQPFEGIEIYSSVTDSTNTLGQGFGVAWLQIYGRTDVIYSGHGSPVERSSSQRSVCIGETFPIRSRDDGKIRQVRLQGQLRIYIDYERKVSQNKSADSTIHRAMMEVPIPCGENIDKADCTSSPPIFAGEHDVWTIDVPPPDVAVEPPSLPKSPSNRPPPPQR